VTEPRTRRVTDLDSLKAVAHPLRARLLAALRIDGPATATELARRLGESSGATSYHLRQLARYDFIEEDPEQPNARDRRWRAAHRYTSWLDSDFETEPEGREATHWLRLHQRNAHSRAAERFEEADWGREWRDASGQSDDFARLTAATLRELQGRIGELIREYAARDADAPDAELVAIYYSGYPVRGYPT
jgi:DNA-binding transcriptional ArsR family regulator